MLRRTSPVLLCLSVCLLAAHLSQAASTLRVDESRIRLLLRDKEAGVSLEVENGAGRAFKARATVELLDPRDAVRAAAETDIEVKDGKSRIVVPFSQIPRTSDAGFPWYRLRYRVEPSDGSALPAAGVVSLSAAAPDLFELNVVTPRRAHGGSPLRATARATNPVTRRPAAGVAVTAELEVEVGEDEEETKLRAAATTGADGLALLDFVLPSGATDDADLKVTARRGAFEQTAAVYVSLEEEPRLLLTTDKPLYQPGQTMHMRALLLGAEGRAGAGEKVTFEVTDEEGSTAFEAEVVTSRFGVASADWAVPASARLGEYRIKLEADDDKYDDDHEARTRVRVSRYELPNFSVNAKADRPFYLAGQDAEIEVRADYLFGQPVKRGRVRLVRETERHWNWREQKYDTEEAETYEGVLDEQGRFVARVPLAKEHEELADSGWRRFDDLTFAAYVTDPTTNRTEQRRLSVRLTKDPIHLYVIEGRYRQSPGLPLALYVTTFYADGTPATCDVDVTEEGRAEIISLPDGTTGETRGADRPVARVRTNRFGVAKVTGPVVQKVEGSNNIPLRFLARDREGRTGRHEESFWLRGEGEDEAPELRVETEKTLYRAGESVAVKIESGRPLTSVLVDAAGARGVVFSRAVKMTGGRGSVVIPYSEEFRNAVRITAASAETFGDDGDEDDYAFDARTVVYPRNRELKLDADFSREKYQPGDEAEVKFAVRSPDGRRAESALGVVVFDKAVEERARTDAEFSGGFGFSDGLYDFWYGRGQIGGVTRRDIEHLDLSRRVPEGMDAVAELSYNDERPEEARRIFSLTRFEHDPRRLFLPLVGKQLLPVTKALEQSYAARSVYPSDDAALARLLSESGVDFGALGDPWGRPYRTRFYTSGQKDYLEIISSGADERPGTEDDFTAGQLSWPYFRPHGERLDRAAADYHARTGGFVRDAATLRSELLRHGLDLDTLRDPWGRPYAFDFDVRESNYVITARSGGPDKTLRPKGAHASDDFEVWTTSVDYFAESRDAIDRALQDVARAGSAFPETEKALAETLSEAGIDFGKVRDGWGRAAYATFARQTRDGARLSLETRASFGGGPPQPHAELHPVRQTIYFVQLRSAGGDGLPNTGDDFDLGRFASITAERPAREAARKQALVAATFTGATGAISGTVTDPMGAAIPNAPVKATHKQTGAVFEAITDDSGVYLLRNLPSGNYRVEVAVPGFKSFTMEEVPVQASNLTRVDAVLEAGGVTETVTVTGSSVELTTTSAQMSAAPVVARPAPIRPPLSTPRLREFFPETLVWQPSVETDAEGRASVRFKLADNITTWKMSVVASTEDGQVGLLEKEILSFQPFFAEHDPPRVLTEGDEISLPVVVRNYLERAQPVQVEMKPEAWFTFKGPARKQTEVAAGDAARPTFDFRATSSVVDGKQRVTAFSADSSDAVEKPVTVHPDGEERAASTSTVFAGSASLELQIPPDALAGSARGELKIYPNLTSHLLEGVEAIMKRPYGCGEQTVSSTYPSVYVLRYYRELGGDLEGDLPPPVRLAAEYARQGYARLLGYRAPGGGFTYWGRGDADLALSAYALRLLKDASEVTEVDAGIVTETRDWLSRQQRADGSWSDDKDARRTAFTTAFVARVLAAVQKREPAKKEESKTEGAPASSLSRALKYLSARVAETDEPYLIASYALAAADAGDVEGAGRAAARLRALAQEEGGGASWKLGGNTPFYGWGRAGVIETTALAVQALSRAGGDNPLVSRGLVFLLRNKDRHGVWLSTQATVNVFDALLALVAGDSAARAAAAQTGGDSAEVFVNGRRAGEVTLPPPGRLTAPVNFDISAFVSPGTNRVEVRRRSTTAQAQAQLVMSYYVPWQNVAASPARGAAAPPRLAVSFDRTTAEAGQEVTCSVEAARAEGYGMMLAEVGLPPGADVDRSSLERAVKDSDYAVNSYDVRPDRVVLYLWPWYTRDPTRLSFKFRPRYGLNALTAPSQIYDYYNPDSRSVLPPTRFVVR
ncbi:MAG TPA: MG2 domain-containing protein [Pyrinomonadaceae bacterium]|jgi:hypothetical protein|nr:MG2 domain-containing protein [Pyrinomonadaceae bacterium]